MAVRLGARSASRDNIFDVLRLGGAMAVLLSHCFPLTGRGEPVAALTGQTLGELGVSVFFAISGFLVARSWVLEPRLVPFAVKRALRLLPALAVASWTTALVLGPLVTALSPGRYLAEPQTWIYPLRSSLLVTFDGRLPGVFAANPYPDAVNGSLWTLPLEACAYGLVAALGMLALLRRGWALVALWGALLVLASPAGDAVIGFSSGDTAAGGNVRIVVQLVAIFAGGAALHALRDRISLSWRAVGILVAAWVLTWDGQWSGSVLAVLVPYATLVVAYRGPVALQRLARPGDVSYGIYLYAFPAQQTVAHLWPSVRPGEMLLVVTPVVYLLAWLSWRLVEAPALALKRRWARRTQEPRVPAS